MTFTPKKDTVYKITTSYKEFNGLQWLSSRPFTTWGYYEIPSGKDTAYEFDPARYSKRANLLSKAINGNTRSFDEQAYIAGMQLQYISVAAIDFEEEQKLYQFREALSPYLHRPLPELTGKTFKSHPPEESSPDPLSVPALLLGETIDQVDFSVTIEEVNVPEDTELLKKNERNMISFLDKTAPKKKVISESVNPRNPAYKYDALTLDIETMKSEAAHRPPILSAEFYPTDPIAYKQLEPQTETAPPLLQVAHSSSRLGEARRSGGQAIEFQPIAFYHPAKMVPVLQSAYPAGGFLEVWNPLRPKILEDAGGQAYADAWLSPTETGLSYFPHAPDVVISLDSAETIQPKEPAVISSVRVAVEGAALRNEKNQQKVQAIADEIRRLTGHQTELLIGSSSAAVHVQLADAVGKQPKILSETWQKLGFSWDIQRTMNRSSLILFSYLGLLSFIFIYTLVTQSLLKRSVDFAILRSFGWKKAMFRKMIMMEAAILAAVPLLPFFIANQLLGAGRAGQGIAVFLVLFAILSISYYAGSRRSLLLPPGQALAGEAGSVKARRYSKISSLRSFAANQMLRRPSRFLLMSFVITLTCLMFYLTLSLQVMLEDDLQRTLKGEQIAVDLKGIQGLFVLLGILLTSGNLFMLTYLNLSERQMEFHVLRTIGWPRRKIQHLLQLEAACIAACGILPTAILGAGSWLLFTAPPVGLWGILLILLLPILQQLLFTYGIQRFLITRNLSKIHSL
ncbi:FtsX-like permease family protein [Sporosarcina sp. BI001-red]|uniref:FtsX-like permease family protein n=1 Tax=Sporosarcina sp. BI001-red TaxID=2282866 RepID=UPI00131433B2|nr:ABC transporter permease [Sporosarcina sp. BI001-red]